MVGKGLGSDKAKRAMREHGCAYFGAVEGTAALLARCVTEVELVAYEDLGAEAIRRLVVEDFAVVVVNNLHGGALYIEGRQRWRRGFRATIRGRGGRRCRWYLCPGRGGGRCRL